jgi:hypothetical protein
MKKNSLLTLTFFVCVLLMSASGNRMQVTGNPPALTSNTCTIPGHEMRSDPDFGRFPLYFITNKGQVNTQAKFYAKTSRYTLWLTKEGLVFDSSKTENPKSEIRNPKQIRNSNSQNSKQKQKQIPNPKAQLISLSRSGSIPGRVVAPRSGLTPPHVVGRDVSRLMFIGANKNPEIVPLKAAKLKVNYFIGSDRSKWHCDVPTSQAVLYKNLYKNIDLKVYGIEKQIEYDWIVKPGGNPADIRIEYKNVKTTRIDKQGNLVIETGFGELIHKKPVSFQAGIPETNHVAVTFKKVDKNTYGFAAGDYDKSRELIIDPVIMVYSTYLGGSSYDLGYDIAVDSSGYVYVTGYTESENFPVLNEYQTYPGGSSDYNVFITKIDTNLNGPSSLIYSTYLGGGEDDYGHGAAIDNSGCVYVAGSTDSGDFPTLNQYQTYRGDIDAFVTKIDTNLSGAAGLIYSTYLGGRDDDKGYGIAADSSGNAYVTGYTSSDSFPTRNAYRSYFNGNSADAFITKIDTTQNGDDSLIYSTFLGGYRDDIGKGIAIDSSGNAYVTGYTRSEDFPTLHSYQSLHKDWEYDAFISKIDTTLSGTDSLVYSTYLGGSGNDKGYGIAADNSGNAYITGYTEGRYFPTRNAYQCYPWWLGDYIAFVTRIDTTLSGNESLIYSTYLGGSDQDIGLDIKVDDNRNVYVTGYTESNDFPVLHKYQNNQGGNDAFVSKIDTNRSGAASLIFSTYLGGSNHDYGYGIDIDSSGYVYVTGKTASTNFPLMNQFQTDPDSYQYDAFITKLIVSLIDVTSPNGGEDLEVDSLYDITWNAPGPIGDLKIDYSINNGASWIEITASTENDGSFAWNVPDNLSSQCLIRISEVNGSLTDTGDAVFSIVPVPVITVMSPNGSENWLMNSQHDITWTSVGLVGDVKLEYSIDNGTSYWEIAAATENDGSYPWTVPASTSWQCLVRITDIDGSPSDTSDGTFSIITPTTITLTSPNGGEHILAGSQHDITWTSMGPVGDVKIEYSTNNGGNWSTLTPSTDNDGFFPWTIPAVLSDQCLIRISEIDGSPSDMSDAVFSIVEPPSLTLISPNGGETMEAGSTHTITWTGSGYIKDVKIEYSIDNGSNWETIVFCTDNTGSYEWRVPGSTSSECLIRISQSDLDDGAADVSDGVFSITSPSAPSILLTSPNGGENLTAGTPHSITWNTYGTVDNVEIEYSTDNGATWTTVTTYPAESGRYEWTVPDAPSESCLIRVSETDGEPTDSSDSLFSIVSQPFITVTSPNGGESWAAGSAHDITWNSSSSVTEVGIEYSADNGVTWTAVVDAMENTGTYNWTIPDVNSNNCLIRIGSTKDGDLSPSDTANHVFAITSGSYPYITVLSPNGGESWSVGSSHNITWIGSEISGEVKVEYSADAGASWSSVIEYTDNDGSFSWIVPDSPSAQCLIRISKCDTDEGPSDISDTVFSIANRSPLLLTSPNDGERLQPGETYPVKWKSKQDIENAKLEFSADKGATYSTVNDSIPNTGSYDWTVPQQTAENCLLRISNASHTVPNKQVLLCELKLMIPKTISQPISSETFALWLGDVKNQTDQSLLPKISFMRKADGTDYTRFNGSIKKIDPLSGHWHLLKILINTKRRSLSLWIDDANIFEDIPMPAGSVLRPGITFAANPAGVIDARVDDFSIKVLDSSTGVKRFVALFSEDFEGLTAGEFPLSCGWVRPGESSRNNKFGNILVYTDEESGNNFLKLQVIGEKSAIVYRSFKMPRNFPFAVSNKAFQIETK